MCIFLLADHLSVLNESIGKFSIITNLSNTKNCFSKESVIFKAYFWYACSVAAVAQLLKKAMGRAPGGTLVLCRISRPRDRPTSCTSRVASLSHVTSGPQAGQTTSSRVSSMLWGESLLYIGNVGVVALVEFSYTFSSVIWLVLVARSVFTKAWEHPRHITGSGFSESDLGLYP